MSDGLGGGWGAGAARCRPDFPIGIGTTASDVPRTMSDPLISIVIPCYNAAAYLGDCVESVLRQEADCEIILVDDGSTDDTLDRARRLMHEHAAMVVVACQRNLGPAASRNTGLRLAQGKYICFLDVDDRFVPGFFAAALSLLEADPSTVAVCCRIELVGAHRAVETWHVEALEQSIPGNMIIRTEAVRQI